MMNSAHSIDVPEHNSPRNMLNILNDHCIQEIFTHLKTRADFLNTAKVCRRFQKNVIKYYPTHLKCVKFLNRYSENYMNEHPSHTSNYSAVFEHLIEAINLEFNEYEDDNTTRLSNLMKTADFRSLNHFKWNTENCPKTLVKLKISNANNLYLDFNVTICVQFQALEELCIVKATLPALGVPCTSKATLPCTSKVLRIHFRNKKKWLFRM